MKIVRLVLSVNYLQSIIFISNYFVILQKFHNTLPPEIPTQNSSVQ